MGPAGLTAGFGMGMRAAAEWGAQGPMGKGLGPLVPSRPQSSTAKVFKSCDWIRIKQPQENHSVEAQFLLQVLVANALPLFNLSARFRQ